MKNKYGLGFLTLTIIAVIIITFAYQLSYHRAKERAEEARAEKEVQTEMSTEIQTENKPATKSEESIAAEGTALKDDCYYLMEVNGYIVVYLSDKKTPYEYTDILYDELPEKLREEIRNGKYIENTKDLYSFLENYSS